jgi:hypothetical protein
MPGCRDVVRDQESGILVPPHDVEAAARALVLLAADPILRARMGAAANKHFHENFTATSVQSAVGRLYRSLLGASHLQASSKTVISTAAIEATDRRQPLSSESLEGLRIVRSGETEHDVLLVSSIEGIGQRRCEQSAGKAPHQFGIREATDLLGREGDMVRGARD